MFRVLLLFSLLSLSACFKVGIPERFYSYQIKQEKLNSISYPHVFIMLPNRLEAYGLDESKSDQILGHQFILGFMPFTSLYLEHGVDSFFLEAIVQYCHTQGIMPVIVSKRLVEAYKLNAINFKGNLDVTVYDLIFSRLLSFSGQLLVNGQNLEIDNQDLYMQIQYPLIGHLLQLSLSNALSESKAALPFSYKTFSGNRGFVPLVIKFPIVDAITKSSLENFAKAYGDRNGVFTASMLSRVIQRGAEIGVEATNNIEAIALAADYSNAKSFSHLSYLQIRLLKLELSDNLKLTFSFEVDGKQKDCAVSQSINSSRDGALNIALEMATKKAVNAFLTKEIGICE